LILFADDTSIIISNANPDEFNASINTVMTEITNWFQSNFLTLNSNKTNFLQFLTKKTRKLKYKLVPLIPLELI